MSISHSKFARELMLKTVYHEAGIVQIASTAHDVNRTLAGMSPEEARKMKRKFRKLWRKAVAHELTRAKSPAAYLHSKSRAGLGEPAPEKRHKAYRKILVGVEMRLAAERLMGKAASFLSGGDMTSP